MSDFDTGRPMAELRELIERVSNDPHPISEEQATALFVAVRELYERVQAVEAERDEQRARAERAERAAEVNGWLHTLTLNGMQAAQIAGREDRAEAWTWITNYLQGPGLIPDWEGSAEEWCEANPRPDPPEPMTREAVYGLEVLADQDPTPPGVEAVARFTVRCAGCGRSPGNTPSRDAAMTNANALGWTLGEDGRYRCPGCAGDGGSG